MSHRGSSRPARVTPYMHGHLRIVCFVLCLLLSLFTYFLFFPFLSFLFQPFQTPFTAVHKKFMSQSLRDFRSGTVVSNDHETPRTADLQLRTGAYGPVTLESATVPVAELLAVNFLVERSVGPIHIHSDCKCVCAGKNKLTQRTKRGAHVTLWTRLQQALSRHQGTVEISLCKAHITADNSHQFGMTPEILVGNPVADALACSLLSVIGVRWVASLGQYSSAYMPPAYLPPRLHRATPLLTLRMCCSPHDVSASVSAPVWRMLHHTLWYLVGKGYHCHVCELSTPARGALDWLRNTICSGPPNSRPDMPVRVGHQTLHESLQLSFHRGVYWCASCGQIAQHAAGKKSRAIGLVNECPRHLTRAGRDVFARIERGRSPKASADWPLMRDTTSVNND